MSYFGTSFAKAPKGGSNRGSSSFLGPDDARQVQFRFCEVSALWKRKKVDAYGLDAKLLVSQYRDLVRRKAAAAPLCFNIVELAHALRVRPSVLLDTLH